MQQIAEEETDLKVARLINSACGTTIKDIEKQKDKQREKLLG